MKLSRRRFISVTAGMATAAMSPGVMASAPVVWRGVALGASVRIVIAGLPENRATALVRLVREEIDRLEGIFSLYRHTSALSALNRYGALVYPPPETLQLFSTVRAIHAGTGGLFDPTIQPLWSIYAKSGGSPSERDIAGALELVGWNAVTFEERSVRFGNRGMQLTLNGIAQGFITDRVVAMFRDEGVRDAIVDIGEIAALGQDATGKDWVVGLAARGDLPAEESISLSDTAVATSSTHGMRFKNGAGHILNPLTGQPAMPYWERISVVHGQAVIADGLSTAAVMLDDDGLHRLAGAFPDATFIARRHDGHELALGRTVG